MHPILAERGRLGAYVAAWTLLGFLLSALLVLAAPSGWAEAFVFAVPLAVLFGFLGLAAFWVCMASPIKAGLARAVATQLPAAFISGSIWLAMSRGWAYALDRGELFPGVLQRQAAAAPLLLGLGVALYLLASALHYMILAFEVSR